MALGSLLTQYVSLSLAETTMQVLNSGLIYSLFAKMGEKEGMKMSAKIVPQH